MEINEKLREEIFGVIERQIRLNDPPETKSTFKRLKDSGYSDFQTKQLIGQCLGIKIFNVLKYNKKYDQDRYLRNLKSLPKEPLE